MIEINLLPGVARKTKRARPSFNPGALVAAAGSRVGDPYTLSAAAGVVIALLAVGGMYWQQNAKEKDLEERVEVAVNDSTRMAAVLKARYTAETARDSVFMQVAIIKSIDDSRYTWPHLLEEINLALPPYTWLTEVTQTSEVFTAAGATDSTKKDTKKDTASAKPKDARVAERQKRMHADSLFNGRGRSTQFRILGQTVDIQALTLFMKNLEGSPFIKNVTLTRSDLLSGERDVTQFELTAETEVPSQAMLKTVPLSIAVH